MTTSEMHGAARDDTLARQLSSTFCSEDESDDDIVLVPWPSDDARRRQLRAAARPRLLVVEAGCAPPVDWDELEDWVRAPLDRVDVMLSRLQAAVTERLLVERHRPVSRAVLESAYHDAGRAASAAAFDQLVTRLQSRLAHLGVGLHRLNGGRMLLVVPS